MLCYIILGVWTASLLQFTLVLTASRARRDQSGVPSAYGREPAAGCCNPEIYGILTSICLQDLPFLVVRLLLIFYYDVVSYTNMFFTSKNSLVIILLVYRVCVVQVQTAKAKEKTIHQISTPLTVSRTTSGENGQSQTTLLHINDKPNYKSRSPRNSLRPSPQESPASSPRTLPRGSVHSVRMGTVNPSLIDSPVHSVLSDSPRQLGRRSRAYSTGGRSHQPFYVNCDRPS